MRRIHVIAAVIRDVQDRILIAKRPDHVHQGGLWEFPGGKLEDDEPRFEGLARELREELGISVTDARPLLDIRHDYPDKSVRLDVWLVTGFDGEAHGAEGQPVRWVAANELDEYEFPAANGPIVRAAQLPERYLITPDVEDEAALFAGLQRAREAGVRLVQLRQTGMAADAYRALVERVLAAFGDDFQLMVKGDEPPGWPGGGWHLTSRQLRKAAERRTGRPADANHPGGGAPTVDAAHCGSGPLPVANRPRVGVPTADAAHCGSDPLPVGNRPGGGAPTADAAHSGSGPRPVGAATSPRLGGSRRTLLAASCHNAEELAMAADLGVDFVTLSPVLPTATHPDAQPLGWERARDLIGGVNMPVYLLGGLRPEELPGAFEVGAQGIAAIRGLW